MGEDGRRMNRRILSAIVKMDIKAIALGTLLILLLETYYIITTPGITLYVFIVDSFLSIVVMLVVASFYIPERNKTEKTIRESEEKYRSLVEDVPDVIYTLDRNGNFTSVNEHALKVLGYQKDELIGQHFVKVIHPDDVEMTLESFKKAVSTKKQKPRGLMFRLLAKDRRVIWVSLNSSMTFDEGGRVLQEQGVARDITERKRAEEELRQYRDHLEKLVEERTAKLRRTNEQLEQDIIERKRAEEALMESEERLRQLIEYAPDAIYINDLNGNFVDGNRQAEKMIGYTKEELIGKNMVEVGLLPEKHVAKALEASEKVLRGQRFGPEEFELIRKDGRWIPVEISCIPVKRKRKVEVINIARDITERKRMEEKVRQYSEHLEDLVRKRTEELLESEKRYSVLVKEASDGVAILQDAKIAFVNKKAQEIISYSRDELIGLPYEKLVDEKYRQYTKELYMGRLRGETIPATAEIELIAKTGERVTVELSGTLLNYQGRPAVLIIVRDIRERKRMEEQHLKLEKLAAIGEAATMVGHDLRNPLQSIEIATSYLNDELPRLSSSTPIPQEATKMLQLLSNSVDYADKIVRDLQDFALTKKPTLTKTDVNAIVKDILSQVEVPENVEFITELGRLPRIEADKDMIKRVLLNLATNGIQAMEKGGTLKVSTKKMRDFVEISFKDTGLGIPEEDMKKIFTPFFTTRAKGMGIGLPICKKFVDAHGGSIEVESEEGKGSAFTVKLPIQQENRGEKT